MEKVQYWELRLAACQKASPCLGRAVLLLTKIITQSPPRRSMNISNSYRKNNNKSQHKYTLRDRSADFPHDFTYIIVVGKKTSKISLSFEMSLFHVLQNMPFRANEFSRHFDLLTYALRHFQNRRGSISKSCQRVKQSIFLFVLSSAAITMQ